MPRSPYIGHGPEHLALWLERLSEPSFVYVIQGEQGTPIKVGFAHDVMARIATLQTGNPTALRLLHVVPGDQRLEWFLHQRLKGARLKGEWFKPGLVMDRFLEYVAGLAERMVAAYDGSGAAPHYADLDPIRLAPHASKRHNPVTVRFVEPDPVVPREVAEKMRRSIAGCSRSEWMGPMNTLAHKKLGHNTPL